MISLTWDGQQGVARCCEVALQLEAAPLVPGLGQLACIAYDASDASASWITPRSAAHARAMTDGEMHIVQAWLRRIRMAALGAMTGAAWDGTERRKQERRAALLKPVATP